MSKVIPFSKNHKKYENVPDGLKWAVPIHECVTRSEVQHQSKMLEVLVNQKIDNEKKMKKIKSPRLKLV